MYPNRSEETEADRGPGVQERRYTALRGCERLLSGTRPRSLRERLAALAEEGEGAYDLDRRPDMYGDGVVRALENRVAELLGTEDAAFFPTGTMAQQVALRIHAEAAALPTVATHPLGHTELHERHALGRLSGLRSVWPTVAPRLPTVAELRAFDEPYAAMILELPLREAGFVLPSWADLLAVAAVVREEHGAALHLDGARIWESVVHFDRPLPEIAAQADSVYVSFYKTLGGISGAALALPGPLRADRQGLAAPLRRPAVPAVVGGARRAGRAWTANCRAWGSTSRTPGRSRRRSSRGSRAFRAPGSTRPRRTPISSSSGFPTPRRSWTSRDSGWRRSRGRPCSAAGASRACRGCR